MKSIENPRSEANAEHCRPCKGRGGQRDSDGSWVTCFFCDGSGRQTVRVLPTEAMGV